jgi:hypothetical protein
LNLGTLTRITNKRKGIGRNEERAKYNVGNDYGFCGHNPVFAGAD